MKHYFLRLLLIGMSFLPFATKVMADEEKPFDPQSSRIIWGPTALPNHTRGLKLTSFDLGFWKLDYSASENLDIGVQTAPPFGIYVLGVETRVVYNLAPQINIGVYGNVGTLGVLSSSRNVLYYGGGPMLTIGNDRRAINFSILTYGAKIRSGSGYAVLPGIGGSVQVSDRMKFNAEGFLITTPGHNNIVPGGAILYGIRVFSETGSVFGDISFLAPIYAGAGELYRFIPMGIPVLAFGFSF